MFLEARKGRFSVDSGQEHPHQYQLSTNSEIEPCRASSTSTSTISSPLTYCDTVVSVKPEFEESEIKSIAKIKCIPLESIDRIKSEPNKGLSCDGQAKGFFDFLRQTVKP